MTAGIADHVLAILLLALGLRSGASAPGRTARDGHPPARDKIQHYLGAAAGLWVMAAVVLAVWIFSGRRLPELGLRAGPLTPFASWTLVLLLAGLAVDTRVRFSPARRPRTRRHWLERTPTMPATARELAFYAILAVSAGLCEELAFRGFLVSYLVSLPGAGGPGVVLAIALPALALAVGHRRRGPRGMLEAAAWAVAGAIVLLDSGSLLAIILAHAGWNVLIGVLGVRLIRHGTF